MWGVPAKYSCHQRTAWCHVFAGMDLHPLNCESFLLWLWCRDRWLHWVMTWHSQAPSTTYLIIKTCCIRKQSRLREEEESDWETWQWVIWPIWWVPEQELESKSNLKGFPKLSLYKERQGWRKERSLWKIAECNSWTSCTHSSKNISVWWLCPAHINF